MSESLLCSQCQQKLVRNIHNKCMYCGAVLPDSLRMSEIEVKATLEEKNQHWEADRARREKADKTHKAGESFTWGGGDWSDGGHGDGGC